MRKQSYGRSLSTVFGDQQEKPANIYDEEDIDPVLNSLRFLEYRYIRYLYHPLKDRFVPGSGWKDPSWTNVKSVRTGLDGDDRAYRSIIFGLNSIEIEQKSLFRLLIDEVRTMFYFLCEQC